MLQYEYDNEYDKSYRVISFICYNCFIFWKPFELCFLRMHCSRMRHLSVYLLNCFFFFFYLVYSYDLTVIMIFKCEEL